MHGQAGAPDLGVRALGAAVALAAVLVACGGADPSALLGDDDASSPDDVVTNPETGVDVTPPPPVTCPSDAGACADPDVPQGWQPVALTANAQSDCPFGSAQDVIADSTIAAGACSCSCTKTQDPSCENGSSTWSGIGPTCATGAAPLTYANGKCRPTSGTVDDYDRATTIPPSGGACDVQSVTNSGAFTSTPVRLCSATGACAAAVCGGYAPSGFQACIVSDGDVACPTGSAFSVKHLVANQAQVQCSACGPDCTFQGSCQNPQLSFYSDQLCSQLIVSIPADGTCDATGHANAVVGGTIYTATPSFTGCTATGSSTGTLSLDAPRTVCCRP